MAERARLGGGPQSHLNRRQQLLSQLGSALSRDGYGDLCSKPRAEWALSTSWATVAILAWFSLTYGLFTEERIYSEHDLLRSALMSGAYFTLIFVILLTIQRPERSTQFTMACALILPITFVWEAAASDVEAAVTTHVVPMGIAIGLLAIPAAGRARLPSPAYVLRIGGVLAATPWLVPITLLIVVVPLFSEDLWKLASEASAGRITTLAGVTILPMLLMVLWQLLYGQFDEIVDKAAAGLRDTESPIALRRDMIDRVLADLELAGSARTGLGAELSRMWQSFRRDDSDVKSHGFERDVLRHAYNAEEFPFYVRYVRARLKQTFRRQIVFRTSLLVVAVTCGSALYIYAITWIVVPVDQARAWAGRTEPSTWDGLGFAIPTGPHLLVTGLTAVIATAIFLALVITTQEMEKAFHETSTRGPLRRCLAVAIPFAKLARDDGVDFARELQGPSGKTLTQPPPRKADVSTPGRMTGWYRWTAVVDGPAKFDLENRNCETWISVYEDSNATLRPAPHGPLASAGGRLQFEARAKATYRIAVDAFRDEGEVRAGDVVVRWLSNDDFGTAQRIEGRTGITRGHNRGASVEPDERGHGQAEAHASVWFRWRADEDGTATFHTRGSSFRTALAVYVGSSIDELAPIAADSDAKGARVELNVLAGTDYAIALDGFDGATGDFQLNWGPPENDNLRDAHSISGSQGQVQGYNAAATSEPGEPQHAQAPSGASVWYRWTAPVQGEVIFDTIGSDFDTLLAVYTGAGIGELVEVASNDDEEELKPLSRVRFSATPGTEYLIAVDGFRAANGRLVLNWDYPPVNGLFELAETIDGHSGHVLGTNRGARVEDDEPLHAGEDGGASVWYRWTAPADGTVTFDTFGSDFQTVLAIYSGSELSELEEIESIVSSQHWRTPLQIEAVAGRIYQVAIDGLGGATGEFALNWRYRPANDDLAGALVLEGESGTVRSDNIGATKEDGEPDHAGRPGSASVWFQWVAPARGEATFDTGGSDFDTLLAVYTGTEIGDLEELAANDDADDLGLQSRVSFRAAEGARYLIAVDGLSTAVGEITLNWTLVLAPANDDFEAATQIEGPAGGVTGHNAGATSEEHEPRHAHVHGDASVWFRWTAPSDGEATFDTGGSDFDTLLAVYTGTQLDELEEIASNDDAEDLGVASRVRFTAQQGVDYRIAIDGYGGESGELALNWTLVAAPSGKPPRS